jgi:hypothetical protein
VLGRPSKDDDVEVIDGALDAPDGKFVALYGKNGRFSAVLGVSKPRQVMAFRSLLEQGASYSTALSHLSST